MDVYNRTETFLRNVNTSIFTIFTRFVTLNIDV
jgi:hypothetical protein